ncbi:MAG: glycosyltransferase family 1 protein [Anaerolineae bacterium]
MHLAIDASRTTAARITGTERYALELLRAMIWQNSGHALHLYYRDTPPPALLPESSQAAHHILPFPRAWTHLRFAAALWQSRPDVTFVPAHTLPFAFPGKALVTVHDLGYKLFPQAHPVSSRLYLDLTTRYSASRATHVLADSQATADDLMRFYGTPARKIHVVYPGVFAPLVLDAAAVRDKYNLPERYFLFLGTLQPRKNIARIVQAYTQYRQHSADPAALVLAGGKGWLYDPAWVEGAAGVQMIGYIDEVDKGALYANALALVFTTLYEGFGFPVLEAMHCGTPVIASTTSSLPELTGEAGLLVDPTDTAAIAAAMQQIETDTGLRAALREKGYPQAQKFTWKAAAAQVWDVIEAMG